MRTLVVVATRREANAIGGGPFTAGAGAAAGRVLSARLAGDDVERVLIAGLCGGLDPSVGSGTAILARRIVTRDQPELVPDPGLFDAVRRDLLHSGPGFVSSSLLTVDRPITRRDEKRDLWNEFGAAGVDMESYHLARAAQDAAIPWLAVRIVLDTAGRELPRGLAAWQRESDEQAIIRQALRRPAEWAGFARLGLQSRSAGKSLRRWTRAVAVSMRSSIALATVPTT